MSAHREPIEEETEPVRCPDCYTVQVTGGKMLTLHTRACAGIVASPLVLVPTLAPCDVCGGPAPCASCAAWSMPAIGTDLVYTLRPLDAAKVKTFKGTVTRIEAAEEDWPAGIIIEYPKLKWKKNLGVSVFHAWPHANLTVEAPC